MKFKIVISLCFSLIFIMELSSEVKLKTYKHFDLKPDAAEEFKTPGLNAKSYKPVVAVIPETIIATLEGIADNVRAFVRGKSLIFQSKSGDQLANFKILTTKKREAIFKQFLVGEKYASLLVQTNKVGSYFIGLTGNDNNIPLKDLLYPRENTSSLVAGFTLTVRQQVKKIKGSKNVSLILPEAPSGISKLHKTLLRNLQSFTQLAATLTFTTFNKKKLIDVDKYYDKILYVIDQLKAKYPDKKNDFELLRFEFLVLAENMFDNTSAKITTDGIVKRSAEDIVTLISRLSDFMDRVVSFIAEGSSFEYDKKDESSADGGSGYSDIDMDTGVAPNPLPSQAEKPDCSNGEDDDYDGTKDMHDPGCSDPNDDSEFNEWPHKPPCSNCGPESLHLCCEIDESCKYSAGLGSDGWYCEPVAP